MKRTLYITSTQAFSGKSALCVGLLRQFHADGFRIGYMKPLSTTARLVKESLADEDAMFVKSSFDLSDTLENMVPVILSDRQVREILQGAEEDFAAKMYAAFKRISQDKDIIVLEGGSNLREGWMVNLSPPQVKSMIDADALVVVPFDSDLQLVDDLITARMRLGDSMTGAVINRVPPHRMEFVNEKIVPYVEKKLVRVFAVLPKQHRLLSVSVNELWEGLGGEILCAEGHLHELVEHLMVGAMSSQSALIYFRRKANKAVITGGDRPDIQLAALETSTRCLILTGNLRPSPMILGKAEEAGVPIILTHYDTMSAVEKIEAFFGKTRFHQEEKIRRFEKLLAEYMDFRRLYSTLGLDRRR